ncbi:TIM23 complex component [Coemansia sp. S610]|nr:TIM23 complex component [Coemansia sp. S610]KAJ2023287.1 TIM23 complex component [Coemansia sp. S85]KAJ2370350.1 TIM23 complex component [Coemansia sp. RSA 2611]KAJ2696115.1 TIM23 complex component [Coemansia sp. IMI 209128]
MLGLLSSGSVGVRAYGRSLGLSRVVGMNRRWVQTDAPVVPEPVTWNRFFVLRKQRRLWERLAALPCALLGLGVGGAIFASLPVHPQQTFMGMDPLLLFGGSTLFCGVLGFVIGPSVGRVFYRLGSPQRALALDLKEAEFFRHVKANRSDPMFSSASNPLPDFYGEKINSLAAYRKWLRKQREHERKGTFKLGKKK